MSLAVGCGSSGNDSPGIECGPAGECPAGFACDPATNRCYQQGASPDAPVVVDASPSDAAIVDAPNVDTVILTSPPPIIAATGARFTFSGTGATSFVCAVDDQTPVACESPIDVTVGEGEHTFTVAAAGDATPAVVTWTVDLTPPDTTVDGPGGTVATTDATLALGATEPATFDCALDDQPFAACTSPAHFSGLAAGAHRFAARATDAAGNVDATPAEAHWTIDVTGPIISVDGTPADQAVTADPNGHFTFAFVDPIDADGGTFDCAIDGGATAPCTSPKDVAFAGDGPHVFGVRGRDRAGNQGPLVRRSFTLDRAAPVVQIGGTPAEGALTSRRQIALVPAFVDASEPGRGSTLTCKLDGAPFTAEACTAGASVIVAADGVHSFTVKGRDLAGNEAQAVRTWTLDATPPNTTIQGPSGTVATTDATFVLGATEAATFECALDGQPFAACASPARLSRLGAGDHRFAARATDAAGNVDPTPAEERWTIDLTGPAVNLDGTPAEQAVTANPNGHFIFAFVDPTEADGGTFDCAIDGSTAAPCTSPKDVVFAGDGPHTFGVRGRDRVGNLGALVRQSFTLDRAAPAVQIGGTPTEGALTSRRQIALVPAFVDASEPGRGSTLTCKLDGAPFTTDACAAGASAIIATDGAHTFTVKGRDLAGNEAQAVRAWTLDTVAPTATLTGPPTNGSITTNRSTTFTFGLDTGAGPGAVTQCRLVGPGINEAFAPAACHDRTNLADGAYQFSVRGVDAAGNVGAPATIAWTIDTQGPPVAWLPSSTPADGATTTSPDVSYAWTFANAADAPGGHLEFSLDGTTWTVGATFVGQLTTQGTNTFRARGVDAVGNIGPTLARTMIFDNQAPVVVLGGTPPNGGFTNRATAFTFAFNPAEPASSVFECSADGATFAAAACVNRAYPDGQHTFALRGRDAAGNLSTPKTVTFTIDTVPPIGTIDGSDPAPGSLSNNRNWSLRVTSNEQFFQFECTFDGTINVPAPCLGGTMASDGVHTAVVRAVDFAGNVGPNSNQISYTLDATPPVFTSFHAPITHNGPRLQTISWTTNEPAAFTCLFNGHAVDCAGGSVTVMEAFGPMDFQVTATDAATNVGSEHAHWSVL